MKIFQTTVYLFQGSHVNVTDLAWKHLEFKMIPLKRVHTNAVKCRLYSHFGY